jgi:hypothetical protein
MDRAGSYGLARSSVWGDDSCPAKLPFCGNVHSAGTPNDQSIQFRVFQSAGHGMFVAGAP